MNDTEHKMPLTKTSTALSQGSNLIDNDEQVNKENHLNGQIIREELMEASLFPKFPHNKAISCQKDAIKVESSTNSSFDFNPNAAGD